MKKILLILVFIYSYILSSEVNLTSEEIEYIKNKKEIIVSNDIGYEPYDMVKDGKASGFSKDFLELLLKDTGLKIKYVSKNWDELITDMDNKKLDVLKSVIKNEEREKKYLFTDSYLKSSDVYITLNSAKKINSVEDLFGKTLAVGKSWALDEYFSKYPQIKKVYANTFEEVLELIENQKADFTVADRFMTYYNITQHGHVNLKINNFFEKNNYNSDYYYAVQKENKILRDIINKRLQNISSLEKSKVIVKWFGIDSVENSNDKNKIALTPKEYDYLKSNKVFNVCTRFNHMPLSGEKDGNIIGISGDIFKRISEKLNVDFIAIKANSDKDFITNINSNKCELVTTLSKDFKGFKNIKTTNTAIIHQKFVAVGNINHFYIAELEDKTDIKFYVLKEVHKKLIEEKYPKIEVQLLNTEDEIINRIKKEDNSFYVTLSILADYAIQKYGFDKIKVIDTIEELSGLGSIGINIIKAPELLSIIDKTLRNIGSKTLEEIVFDYKVREFRIVKDYTWLWYLVAFLVLIVIVILSRYLFLAKKLNKEESIYREILENSVSKVAFIDKNYKYKKVNDKYAQMLGKDKKDIENNPMNEVLGDEYFYKNLKDKIDLSLNGENVEFEVKFKDRIILANYSPFYEIEEKEASGVIFNLLDITEKKEAQAKEKELSERLKKAQEIGQLGAWKYRIKDNSFVLTGIVAKLHDVESLKEVSPEICFRKGYEDDIPKMAGALENTLKDMDFKKELIYRIYNEKNEIRYMEVKWEHVFDKDRNLIGIDGVGQDITEEVLSKQREEEQQEMLMHSQRLAQQGEMLQMIGHQWRQPLSQISLNAQLLEVLVENPDEVVMEKINSIVEVTEFLSKTISDFKHFFTDKKELVEFKVEDAFRDSLSVINHRIKQSGVVISENFVGTETEIKAYKTELGQVVLAIVNNAIDVLEEKENPRNIDIDVLRTSDKVTIKIKDNAGGIPENIINHIFDPYFSTKLEKNGTGLGLYMSKMIIEKSFNGTIKAANIDDGACFIIEFPPLCSIE